MKGNHETDSEKPLSLNRDTPIPLYYQLKSFLLQNIQNGTYTPGDQIPTENELHSHYQVSRSTIRQAINELVNDGWLERKPSKGTFVTNPSQEKYVFHSFEPFYSLVKNKGKTPRTEILEMKVITANNYLSSAMNLEIGQKVITMFRLRFVDDEPIVTVRNFLPFSNCSFILNYDFRNQSLYELLMQNPHTRLKLTRTTVSAEKATAEDVNLLGAKIESPMLVFNNTSLSSNDKIIDYAFSHYRGDLSNFEFEHGPT